MNNLNPIGSIDCSKKIHIYGAGIAGLFVGHQLKKLDKDFIIYEKSAVAGGKIQTKTTPHGIAETAANAIFTNDDVLELLKELKLNLIYSDASLRKVIFRNGAPQSPPVTIAEIIVNSPKVFKKVPLEHFNSLTMKEFFLPLAGEKIIDEVISAAFRGIYSTGAEEIHMASLFPQPIKGERYFQYFKRIIKDKKKYSSQKAKSVSFKNGMKELTLALSEELKDNIEYNSDVSIKENSIICTEAYNAKAFFPKESKLFKALENIEYTNIASTTVFMNQEIPFMRNAFGILFPKDAGFKTMGILSNNNIFPGRSVNESIYSYTFITENSKSLDKLIMNDLNHFNIDLNCWQNHLSTSWSKAIPKYNYKRFEAINTIKSEINNFPNVMLFGNYTNGISIREMASFSKRFI
ncbi:MAG: oxygen-dependent protoporphyrinogen oxidase [Thermoproteota archaeon]|jgi:oxygen-dependent protoporphyrinogen oxidase